MLWPALDQFPYVGALWFYAAAIHMSEGKSVLAMHCWQKCYDLEGNPEVLVNLGATARLTNQVDLSRAILRRLLDYRPDDPKALANLCGNYVNEGCPQDGIPYGERCIALDPAAGQGRFNLGLLYLEDGQFGKGFDCYAGGYHRMRTPKVYNPDPPMLTPEMHERLTQRVAA
jgi:tetratricopeptide (TPR) repeat protein